MPTNQTPLPNHPSREALVEARTRLEHFEMLQQERGWGDGSRANDLATVFAEMDRRAAEALAALEAATGGDVAGLVAQAESLADKIEALFEDIDPATHNEISEMVYDALQAAAPPPAVPAGWVDGWAKIIDAEAFWPHVDQLHGADETWEPRRQAARAKAVLIAETLPPPPSGGVSREEIAALIREHARPNFIEDDEGELDRVEFGNLTETADAVLALFARGAR